MFVNWRCLLEPVPAPGGIILLNSGVVLKLARGVIVPIPGLNNFFFLPPPSLYWTSLHDVIVQILNFCSIKFEHGICYAIQSFCFRRIQFVYDKWQLFHSYRTHHIFWCCVNHYFPILLIFLFIHPISPLSKDIMNFFSKKNLLCHLNCICCNDSINFESFYPWWFLWVCLDQLPEEFLSIWTLLAAHRSDFPFST